MGIKYYKLFDMLNRRGLKKTDLRKIMSPRTVTKLSKGEHINTSVLEKICDFLDCQPGDIMEYTKIATDNITGQTIEVADHTSLDYLPEEIRPEPDDINIYPTDKDSPYEEGYKKRLY